MAEAVLENLASINRDCNEEVKESDKEINHKLFGKCPCYSQRW